VWEDWAAVLLSRGRVGLCCLNTSTSDDSTMWAIKVLNSQARAFNRDSSPRRVRMCLEAWSKLVGGLREALTEASGHW